MWLIGTFSEEDEYGSHDHYHSSHDDAGYSAPATGYGAPSSSYAAPSYSKPSYSAPSPSYSAPSSGYSAPSSGHGHGHDAGFGTKDGEAGGFFDSTMKMLGEVGTMGMSMLSGLFNGGHEHGHGGHGGHDAEFHAHVDPNTQELRFTDVDGNDITDKVIFVDQQQQQQQQEDPYGVQQQEDPYGTSYTANRRQDLYEDYEEQVLHELPPPQGQGQLGDFQGGFK